MQTLLAELIKRLERGLEQLSRGAEINFIADPVS